MKESVTKFDLEAAFKALDELDIPVAKKGIAANRVNLKETFNKKLKTEALIEDYYDVNNSDDLNKASEERQAEVAQAKLARIEKIVDLDAETEEDILPSYEGKVIVQCPQCMTLFYKNPEDVEASEDDDSVVNVGEVCQHCGNESGYTVIGKVAAVEPEAGEETENTDELNLDFEEPVDEDEEEPTEDTANAEEATEAEPEESSDEENLDLIPMEEEPEEEKKEESLASATSTTLNEAADEIEETEEVETEEPTENDNAEALEILKDKIDVHGDGDTVIIAEKGQLDNEEAPKVEVEVSEEEFDALEKEFHENSEEEKEEETVEESLNENINILNEEDLNEWNPLGDAITAKKYNNRFKKYEVECWKKAGDGESDRTEKAEAKLPFGKFEDAKKKAVAFSKNSNNGIADIYGLEENGERKLLTTLVNGKDSQVASGEIETADYFDLKQEKKDTKAAEKEAKADAKASITPEDLDTKWVENKKGKWQVVAENSENAPEAKSFEKFEEAQKYALNISKGFGKTLVNPVDSTDKALEAITIFDNGKRTSTPALISFYQSLEESLNRKLTESDGISESEFKELMNSAEFKEPISEEEVESYMQEAKKTEDFKEVSVEEALADIEDIDEACLTNCISKSLTDVYENVKSFTVSNCELNEGKLFVEGIITFNSDKTRAITYKFNEALLNKNNIVFKGLNESLANDGNFTLNCKINEAHSLETNSLSYNYKINEDAIKGIANK